MIACTAINDEAFRAGVICDRPGFAERSHQHARGKLMPMRRGPRARRGLGAFNGVRAACGRRVLWGAEDIAKWRQAKPKATAVAKIAGVGLAGSYETLGSRRTGENASKWPNRSQTVSRGIATRRNRFMLAAKLSAKRVPTSGPHKVVRIESDRRIDGHAWRGKLRYGSVGERSSESDDAPGFVLHAAIVLSNGPTHLGQRDGPFSRDPESQTRVRRPTQ